MHELTEKILSVVSVVKCDHNKVDEAVKQWCSSQLAWLENGDTSLRRIRTAFGGKERKIVKNAAVCRICGDEVESKHRHDFVTCKCGRLSVDGGKDYIRRSYGDKNEYEDRSVYA